MDNGNHSDKKLMNISEFSKIVGIPCSTLRYYDREGIFAPAIHGNGREQKYRYYTPAQITTVKMIRVLVEIGVDLTTIKSLTNERSPEKLMKLFAKYKRSIAGDIRYFQEVYSIMDTFHKSLIEGLNADENDIFVCEMPEIPIILGEPTNFSGSVLFYDEFLLFCNTSRQPKLNLSYPVGGFFDSMKAFLSRPSEPTRFFSLNPNGYEHREKGLYLIAYTRGYYGQTNDMPQRMDSYAKNNGIVFDGPVYNTYLFDELSISDSDQYLLQAAASVKETRHKFSHPPRRYLSNKKRQSLFFKLSHNIGEVFL